MRQRLRECVLPLLVVLIVGSLWVLARAQEMEEDMRLYAAPSPEWDALVEQIALTE